MRLLPWMPASVAALLFAAPSSAFGQAPADSGAFVSRLGHDTLTVERYVRTADQLVAEALVRSPETRLIRMRVDYGSGDRVEQIEWTVRPPDAASDAAPARRTVVTFEGDSATVATTSAEGTRTRRVAARPDAVPELDPFYAPIDLILQRARAARGDSLVVPIFTGGGMSEYVVTRVSADSMAIHDETFGARPARVDRTGRLLAFQAVGSRYGTIVERLPWPDLDALASRYAGRGLGSLSPRDTVRAGVHGAQLLVDYSRPAKRGREVFGALVPWDEVWRTGANRATHFTTDRALVAGDVTIPAGTYTLYSIPSPSGWTLIVNRQTGQGGLNYDPSQDLARLAMKVETLPEVVERFTIAIEPEGAGGVLSLVWDRTAASLAFRVP